MATLEVIERDNLINNGKVIGDYMRERIKKEVSHLGILGEVRGEGCLVGVEFVESMESKKSFPADRRFGKRVEMRLLEEGLILRCDPEWIAFAPPLITTINQADKIIDIFVLCLKKELKSKDGQSQPH